MNIESKTLWAIQNILKFNFAMVRVIQLPLDKVLDFLLIF